jgi:hypothetical protein
MPKPPVSAVYGRAQREPLPLRLKEYPRDKASLCERDAGLCNRDRNKVKGYVALLGTRLRALTRRRSIRFEKTGPSQASATAVVF